MKALHKRLARLEAEVAWRQGDSHPDGTYEELVAEIKRFQRGGLFAEEPDFDQAFEQFQQDHTSGILDRLITFDADAHTIDEELVRATVNFVWLCEILNRASSGIPAVTVAEFEELAEWFHANRQDLATKGKRLQLGNGHTTTVADLERRLRAGAKSRGAGLLAVELRKLRG